VLSKDSVEHPLVAVQLSTTQEPSQPALRGPFAFYIVTDTVLATVGP